MNRKPEEEFVDVRGKRGGKMRNPQPFWDSNTQSLQLAENSKGCPRPDIISPELSSSPGLSGDTHVYSRA